MARQPLAVARQAERSKHAKYDDIAASISAQFFPFIMETHGGFGPEALKLIGDLIPPDSSPFDLLWPLQQSSQDLRASLSMALQRGNAQAVLVGLAHSRAALTRDRQQRSPPPVRYRPKRRRTSIE